MKKILTSIVVALGLLAPAILPAQTPTTAPENPAHEELRKLRDGLLAAMNKGDLEGTLAFMHTNVVITWEDAEVSRGYEGVRAYHNRIMTGPNKIVDAFNFGVNVDELTILHGS